MRKTITVIGTLVLAAGLVYAGHGVSSAKTKTIAHKPVKSLSGAALIAHGNKMVADCRGCHSPQLEGKPGFSPSLHTKGVLKEYNVKTFERVMNTGVTNDGGKVKKPMPIYQWKAADSDAAYAYLKTLK